MITVKHARQRTIGVLVTAGLLSGFAGSALASTDETAAEPRVTETRHLRGDGRENATLVRETRDEFDQFRVGEKRSGKTKSGEAGAAQGKMSMSANDDFWFYLADVELFADEDRDGYYSGIDLLFDVDTWYSAADIYAVAYLSLDGGPWEEYAVTDDFTIFGSSGSDDYIIVSDLVSGYPTGDYDLLIEVFDAGTDEFLAWYGPEDTSELSYLPLEDINRDTPAGGSTTVVVNRGGGGALGGWMLALVGLLVLARRGRATCRPVPGRP